MAGWTRRLLSVVALFSLMGVPVFGASCAWVCGHTATHVATSGSREAAHHEAAVSHCHDAAPASGPALEATSTNSCPLDPAASEEVTVTLASLRGDARVISLGVPPLARLAGVDAAPFTLHAARHASSRSGPSSNRPRVLRI